MTPLFPLCVRLRRALGTAPAALLLVGTIGLVGPSAIAAPPADRQSDQATPAFPAGDRWYRLEIDGAPAGWALERIRRDGKRVTTVSRMTLNLRRGATEIAVELASRFVESADGRPIELWQRQSLGQLPVESTYRFQRAASAGGPVPVEVTTVQAGRETRRTVPAPGGGWLTPDAARRALLEARREGEETFTARLLEPFQGLQPVTLERTLLGPATVPGAVDRWRERRLTAESEETTQSSVVELDSDGRVVRSVSTFLGLELTLERTDRERARAGASPGAGPELMVSTFVIPDRPIPAPRRLRRAVYELSLIPAPEAPSDREGATPRLPALPETDAQWTLPSDGEETGERPGTIRVAVEAGPSSGDGAGTRPAPPPDADGVAVDPAPFLASSPFLDHRDPAVRTLLEAAAGADRPGRPARFRPADGDPLPPDTTTAPSSRAPSPDPRRRAARLAAFVRGLLTDKSLDTGFATASEVARTHAGDCTEHAVLLAALLRADGIPSRVVSGLVYLDAFAGHRDVFGYHMWTQALVGGRWVDLDAALPGDVDGFDATHVAVAVSSLSGSEAAADFAPVAALIGRLRIRVLETAH